MTGRHRSHHHALQFYIWTIPRLLYPPSCFWNYFEPNPWTHLFWSTVMFSLPDRKGKESAAMKADLLRARDMKRYINQLTVAKKQCEKRIRLLGGPNYENNEDGAEDETEEPQSQKVGSNYLSHRRLYMSFSAFIIYTGYSYSVDMIEVFWTLCTVCIEAWRSFTTHLTYEFKGFMF